MVSTSGCTSLCTAHASIALIMELVHKKVIALESDKQWAPHSPDLNPLDFWLWGAAKNSVYKSRPETLEELKDSVSNYITQVLPDTWEKVGLNFKIRIAACRQRRDAHIEHVSYHKLAEQ